MDTAERAVPRAGAQLNGQPHDWDSRSPTTIAAAVIYLVTCLPKVLIQESFVHAEFDLNECYSPSHERNAGFQTVPVPNLCRDKM